MRARIPVLVAIPALLIACEETEPSGDAGAADAGGDVGADAVEDTTPVDETVRIPSSPPDLTAVDCGSATGADAFFCDWVDYCGWFSDCYPEDFSDVFENVSSCEASYAASLVSAAAGEEITPACASAWAAITACHDEGCSASCDYAPAEAACAWMER